MLEGLFPKPAMRESIAYVLKHLREQQIRKTYYKTIDGHLHPGSESIDVWLPAMLPEILLGTTQYRTIMDLLRDHGLLDIRQLTKNKRTYSYYSFRNPKHLTESSSRPISFQVVEKKCRRFLAWRKVNMLPIDYRVIEQMVANFGRINLEKQQFTELWRSRYHEKYLLKHPENPMPEEEYMGDVHDLCWATIDGWNEAKPEQRASTMHADGFGNRLHHVFTYLPSEIRGMILDHQGKPVEFIAFDLRNSQPAIFANLLVTEHGVPLDDPFVKAVSEGRIYEDLMERLGVIRDIAKQEIMHYLYCPVFSPAQEEFEEAYPRAATIAAQYKRSAIDLDGNEQEWRKRHRVLAQKMQRAESEMFRPVWEQCLRDGMAIIPVHDAIYIRKDHNSKRYMKFMIQNILGQFIKIPFEVRYEEVG